MVDLDSVTTGLLDTGPRRSRRGRVVAAIALSAALGLAVTACSAGSASGSSSTTTTAAAKLTACPQSPAPAGFSGGGGGAGGVAPAGTRPAEQAGAGASIPVAKTIKKVDTANSVVVDPTGAQIQCGNVQVAGHDNVVYATPTTNGKQTALKMDIQVPRTTAAKPLVIYLTGGGFDSADQTGNLDQRTYIADQGYVVASIQYRTIPDGAVYSDAIIDVKSAIRYLRAHAGTYGINANEVFVWGQSAGGYLASMTGVTNGLKQFDSGDNLNESSAVQGVVDEFGPSDLSTVGDDYDTATKEANQAPGNNLAQWVYGPTTTKSVAQYTPQVAAADPDTYVSSSTPPFVLLQGTDDQLVSPSQTLLLDNTLKTKGARSARYLVQGAGHGDLSVPGVTTQAARAWSTQVVMGKIVDFLNQNRAN